MDAHAWHRRLAQREWAGSPRARARVMVRVRVGAGVRVRVGVGVRVGGRYQLVARLVGEADLQLPAWIG